MKAFKVKEIPHKEPIADSSHPIWAEIEREKERMGEEKWVEFVLALAKSMTRKP